MNLTGWLDFFVDGLATQLDEVKERGERVLVRDVLVQQHRLSPRLTASLGFVLEHGSLTIQDFEQLCPDTNRRSLQRDLKAMLDKGLLIADGATNQLIYRLKD